MFDCAETEAELLWSLRVGRGHQHEVRLLRRPVRPLVPIRHPHLAQRVRTP